MVGGGKARADAQGYDVPYQSTKTILTGFFLIGLVIAGATFLHFKTETRSERNLLKIITMSQPKKIEELTPYDGAEIITSFDEFRTVKIRHNQKETYLYLPYDTYAPAKNMARLDVAALAEATKKKR